MPDPEKVDDDDLTLETESVYQPPPERSPDYTGLEEHHSSLSGTGYAQVQNWEWQPPPIDEVGNDTPLKKLMLGQLGPLLGRAMHCQRTIPVAGGTLFLMTRSCP